MPSGTDSAGRSATGPRPTSSRMSSTAAASSGESRSPNPLKSRKNPSRLWRPSRTRRATIRCSRTVSSLKSSMRWNVRANPSLARACGLLFVTSTPFRRTRPDRGRISPESTPNRVVFPAPFGPTSPTARPCGTRILTESSATTPPKRTVTSSASRSAVEEAGSGSGSVSVGEVVVMTPPAPGGRRAIAAPRRVAPPGGSDGGVGGSRCRRSRRAVRARARRHRGRTA